MTQVDRVIQTNAAAAEELSSTAEEMASLILQQLMSFFQTKAPATHLNRFSAMRYQSPPASAAENESDRGLHHQRTPLELSRSTGRQTLTAMMTNSHVGGD
jgi:hypothetical protein